MGKLFAVRMSKSGLLIRLMDIGPNAVEETGT